MNYRDLFKIAFLLISSPAKAWEEIRVEEDRRKVLMGFVYPMIGLCVFAAFLGSLFRHGWGGPEAFQIAMRQCCIIAVALFGGYYLTSYIINSVGVKLFGLPDDNGAAQQFVGYALVVAFCAYIIEGFFPTISLILLFLQLYTVYIVWEGVPLMTTIKEEQRLKYTLFTSIIIILCPACISILFKLLLLLLN